MKHVLRGAFAIALLASTATFANAAADLVPNGAFGSGGSNPSLTGWTSYGQVYAHKEGDYSPFGGTGGLGTFFASFGDSDLEGGTLFTTLATEIGKSYTLSFDYGSWGVTNPQSLKVSVSGALTKALNQTITDSSLTKSFASVFTNYTFTFTATTTNSILKFIDDSNDTFSADGLLTNVSVKAVTAVPGPEAGAGLGALALGGMALYMKRRRKDDTIAA